MAWKSLKDPATGLNARPRVLAGPVLRKVTSTTVTVWVVLRMPAKVTLKVLDDNGSTPLMAGDRHTVAIGTNLHIVAITAKQLPVAQPLKEGKIYQYDLSFEFDDGKKPTLAEATDNAKLTYAPFDKPTFCLPPADINRLRIIHGSCRIPHGNGADALPTLDELIDAKADDAYARPHQLLLTGDQIYADDVGYAMSMMLMDASEALLGWTEEILCNMPALNTRRAVTELYPGIRQELTQTEAGFTSADFHGQLIGLGEYLAMYLFVWSDVLWPASPGTLPSADEIQSFIVSRTSALDEEVLGGMERVFDEDRRYAIDLETARTSDFGRTIKDNVRRALANIPSYMIFDDHEITDDWNMTSAFCARVYGSPLGLRIVQNGLTAYALCQHWGNVPEQFDAATSGPGAKLLTLLDKMSSAAAYDSASATARSLLGIAPLQGTPKGLHHGAGALTYNYTIEGEGHQVIMTDTRTWREYPRPATDGGDLMPLAQLEQQIGKAEPLRKNGVDRMQLVVLTTNAPPAQPIRTASRHPRPTKAVAKFKLDDASPDLYESWEMPRDATDLLFRTISDRLPVVDGKRHGSVLLLSGDVHTSFTSRMLFRGSARFKDPTDKPQPVNMVFAQMVCSPFRKQDEKTEGMHVDGYAYGPSVTSVLVPALKPEVYLGWNRPAHKTVGRRKNNPGSGGSYTNIDIERPRTYSIWDMPFGFKEDVPHEWSYRLDYLLPEPEVPLPSSSGTPIPPDDYGADVFNEMAKNYRKYQQSKPRQMVGVNNIGEITFKWSGTDATKRHALHTLRWRDWQLAKDRITTYSCSLDPGDTKYHDLGILP